MPRGAKSEIDMAQAAEKAAAEEAAARLNVLRPRRQTQQT